MLSTFLSICTLACCLLITSVTSKSLLPSYWSKEVIMKRKSVEKACVPFCKVFSTVCNYGECRQKIETDCEWYCECPPDCIGRFCEKLIKPEDNTSTSNPPVPNVYAAIPNVTSVKESTKVQPSMDNDKGNSSKVVELSTCPPELNGTVEKVLISGNMKNTTESGEYSSSDEINQKSLSSFLSSTKNHMVSHTTPVQLLNNFKMQQLLPTESKLWTETTVKPVSFNEHTTGSTLALSGVTSIEGTVFSSPEKSTRHTNEVPSDKIFRTEKSILIKLLNNSLDQRSFNVNNTSLKSTASTAIPVTTPSYTTNLSKHEFAESNIDKKKVELPMTQRTVTVVTTEQKPEDADFANNLNTSSNTTSTLAEGRHTITISIANFKGNVPTLRSKLEDDTKKEDQIKQLRVTSTERTTSFFVSTSMPDQVSLANITGQKASDKTTNRSSITLVISKETTPVNKDEITSSDIEMRTIKFNVNLTMETSEYSSTHPRKILHTDVYQNTTPLAQTLDTVIDQPISNSDTLSDEFKVPLEKEKLGTGESLEVENNIDNTTFIMKLPSLGPTDSSNHTDKIKISNVQTTAMDTLTNKVTVALMTTVDQKLKSNQNSENLNMATEKGIDNDFVLKLKDIKPESNSLVQSKAYHSQELLETGKESTFP